MIKQFHGPRTPVAAAVALLFAVSFAGRDGVLRAEDTCDATTLTGNYGYSLTGYVYDRQGYSYYLASVGIASSDGAGALSGSETMSFDGTILKRKYTGTYTINADCTGSVTITYSDNAVLHGDLVILNDAKEVNLVQTDAPFIYSGVLKKQRTQTAAAAPTTPPAPTQQSSQSR